MTWDETTKTIITGVIGLGIGLAVAGKAIKDISSTKIKDDENGFEINRRWK